ncbi:MAG: hypothetical protein ABJH05_09495 [Fulvivirga sp.]
MGGSSAEWVLGVGSWKLEVRGWKIEVRFLEVGSLWMGDIRYLVISEGNKALTAERRAQRACSGLLSLAG